MTPTGSDTEALNGLLWRALQRSGLKFKLFESSTGFRLPDNSLLSPDASLLALARWRARSEHQQSSPPSCGRDLVVEWTGRPGDEPRGLKALRQKMAACQRIGARLGSAPPFTGLAIKAVDPRRPTDQRHAVDARAHSH